MKPEEVEVNPPPSANAVLPPPLHLQNSAASGVADQGSSGIWKEEEELL